MKVVLQKGVRAFVQRDRLYVLFVKLMQVLAGRAVVAQAYFGHVIWGVEASSFTGTSGDGIPIESVVGEVLREIEKRVKRKKVNFAWDILLS